MTLEDYTRYGVVSDATPPWEIEKLFQRHATSSGSANNLRDADVPEHKTAAAASDADKLWDPVEVPERGDFPDPASAYHEPRYEKAHRGSRPKEARAHERAAKTGTGHFGELEQYLGDIEGQIHELDRKMDTVLANLDTVIARLDTLSASRRKAPRKTVPASARPSRTGSAAEA